MVTGFDFISKCWKERLERVHPMVFDGCEDSKDKVLEMIKLYEEKPTTARFEFIETNISFFELASTGWESQMSEVSS